MTLPPTHPVDVLLILTHRELVLFALREGTGYADGQFNLPSGKLEPGEDAVSAMQREAREEIGLDLDASTLELAATVHHRNSVGLARVGLVFTAAFDPAANEAPFNAEPHKCAKIEWIDPDKLPHNTYPYTEAAVDAWRRGLPLRLSGWA